MSTNSLISRSCFWGLNSLSSNNAPQNRSRINALSLCVAAAISLASWSNGVVRAADETPSTQPQPTANQSSPSAKPGESNKVVTKPSTIESYGADVVQFFKAAGEALANTPEYKQYQQILNSKAGQAWLRATPEVTKADKAREAGLAVILQQIDQDLHRLADACQMDQFVSDAVSLNSQFQYFTGRENLKRSLSSRFKELVLSQEDVASIIESRMQQFNKQLATIDNSLLIAIKTDTNLDPAKIKVVLPSFSEFDAAIASIVECSELGVWNAITETAFSAGVGTLVGGFATQFMQSSGWQDALGGPAVGRLVTTIGGIAVGFASDAVISRLADTPGKLKQELERNFGQSFSRLYIDDSSSEIWTRPFRQLVERHNEACIEAIISDLKLDRKWAVSLLR